MLIDLAIYVLKIYCSSLWHLKVDNGQFKALSFDTIRLKRDQETYILPILIKIIKRCMQKNKEIGTCQLGSGNKKEETTSSKLKGNDTREIRTSME